MKKRANIDPLLAELAVSQPDSSLRVGVTASSPALPAPRAEAEAVEPPIDLDYRPLTSGERWRVEKFEFLALEFGLIPDAAAVPLSRWQEAMGAFHEIVTPHSRWWLFVRRIYGVMPLIPPASAHPDEMRPWRREELCDSFGISKDELKQELEAIRALWGNHCRENEEAKDAAPSPAPSLNGANGEAPLLVDDNLLEEFGFEESMFKVEWKEESGETVIERKRPDEENRREKNWFCSRLGDWARMLREPMAHAIARECLLDELQLKRIEVEMFQHRSGSPAHTTLQKTRAQLQSSYSNRLDQLQEMFPEMGVAGKVAFKGQVSDLIQAYTEAIATGDFKRLDRVRTAGEIAVDLRPSVQSAAVKYRMGQTLYIIEAMNGLFDPDWRSRLKPAFLRKLDVGFAEAVDRVRREGNEALVDLMKEGPAGEYADDVEAIS